MIQVDDTVNDTRKSIIAWNNFSSWIKLLKAISFLKHIIQRFKRHNKTKDNKLSEPTKGNQNNKLVTLNPIFYNNVIKVGGRLIVTLMKI